MVAEGRPGPRSGECFQRAVKDAGFILGHFVAFRHFRPRASLWPPCASLSRLALAPARAVSQSCAAPPSRPLGRGVSAQTSLSTQKIMISSLRSLSSLLETDNHATSSLCSATCVRTPASTQKKERAGRDEAGRLQAQNKEPHARTWQEFEPGFLSRPQNLQPKMPRP